MKKENKNNYYNDVDKINFEKLNNFKKFNNNLKNSTQYKNHNIKYSNSDKNYFNNIIKTEENLSLLNEGEPGKEISYYNVSDFKKFDYLNNFPEYEINVELKKSENIKSKLSYTSNDFDEFNKIIQPKNKNENITKNQDNKIKIIDYNKLKESEKKLKNKVGIKKIKVVYFD